MYWFSDMDGDGVCDEMSMVCVCVCQIRCRRLITFSSSHTSFKMEHRLNITPLHVCLARFV